MPIYRISVSGSAVGAIAANSQELAQAFAQGRYGAGADVELVATKLAVASGNVCEILLAEEVSISRGLEGSAKYWILK